MHSSHVKDTKHFGRNPACIQTALNNSALIEGDDEMVVQTEDVGAWN